MKQYAIVVDVDRCIGCHGGCQIACKTENNIGLGRKRSTLYTVTDGVFPDVSMFFVPVMCQQCEDPICAKVCPTGACYKDDEDGVIRIDTDVCIGCQTCKNACPFQANNFNAEMRVMDKCTICSQRREKDEKPACVNVCPGGALHYGDINDPNSEVSKLLAANEGHVYTLQDDKGCKPSGRFILRNDVWKDPIVNSQIEDSNNGK